MAPPIHKKAKGSRERENGASKPITDPRFTNIQTDPRYRLPSRKHTHVQLDNRFSRLLEDDDFYKKASVDRYGRKIPKTTGRRELQKLYRVDKDDDNDKVEDESDLDGISAASDMDDDVDVQRELAEVNRKYDPSRDGGFSESSSSSESEGDDDDSSSDESDADIMASTDNADGSEPVQEEIPVGEISSRLAIVNLDWDNIRAVDIMAVCASFCPPDARVLKVSVYPSEFGKERMEREELEGPPKELFRGAGKAHDQPHGQQASDSDDLDSFDDADVDDEAIKEKLMKEGTSADFDPRALRSYQLSRLRYFYAIITTTSADAALAIYNAMDGREYLSTANFFDLRFVPDDVTFPDSDDPAVPRADRARDECTKVPDGYQVNEFVTDALTHSKVRLTWDEDDRTRKEAQKRAFSRQEIDENDLKAYIGSDSSDGDDNDNDNDQTQETKVFETDTTGDTAKSNLSRADIARQKMRMALGLSVDPTANTSSSKKPKAPVGDMQITFTTALSSKDGAKESVFTNEPEETTRERYIRLEKERKARRKAKARAAREGGELDSDEDARTTNDIAPTTSGSTAAEAEQNATATTDGADPFADPFFEDPAATNKALQKAARRARRERAQAEQEASAARKERERRELELIMVDDGDADANGVQDASDVDDSNAAEGALPRATGSSKTKLVKGRHFDMREIVKAEKEEARLSKGKKWAKKMKAKKEQQQQQHQAGANAHDHEYDHDLPLATDPRFAALYDSHEYAIDPTNPRFSGTKAMKKMLEEGRKRRAGSGHGYGNGNENVRREGDDGDAGQARKRHRGTGDVGTGEDLDELVRRVKRREQRA